MPAITIRQARPQSDFERIAALRTIAERYPVTAEELHEDENRRIAGKIRRRWVAVDGDGRIAGYALAVHYPSQPAGNFHVAVIVDPLSRGQGIGAALYDEALAFVRQHGGTQLYCEVREESPESLRFAERRGFKIATHAIESVLDLAGFDERSFAGLVEGVEASGITFLTYAATGNTPEAQQKLYAINRTASTDDPASLDDSFPSFENWRKIILEASNFQPEGQILAAHGDRYVGLAAVSYDEDSNTAESLLAGVDRAYRGRKIAQALKLLTIRFALARGATQITTENNSRNEAMLAINRKFGYTPVSGYFGLVCDLSSIH